MTIPPILRPFESATKLLPMATRSPSMERPPKLRPRDEVSTLDVGLKCHQRLPSLGRRSDPLSCHHRPRSDGRRSGIVTFVSGPLSLNDCSHEPGIRCPSTVAGACSKAMVNPLGPKKPSFHSLMVSSKFAFHRKLGERIWSNCASTGVLSSTPTSLALFSLLALLADLESSVSIPSARSFRSITASLLSAAWLGSK